MKAWLIAFTLGLLPGLVNAQGELQRTLNLQPVGQQAIEAQRPVVLFFNASYCRPCETLKQRAFNAILRFNQFPAGTQFVEVFI